MFIICAPCWATDYYVATTGSDSDPGTVGQPFLTIQKGVNTAINADDRVLINDGTYSTGFTLSSHDGSVDATKNITGITQANPAVVTVASHGYSNGDVVVIQGLTDYLTTGMVHLNDHFFTIANVTTNTFELSGIDSTYFDPWISGGTVAKTHLITIKAINRGNVTIDQSQVISGWSNSGQPANTYLSTADVAGGNGALWKVGYSGFLIPVACGSVTIEGTYCKTSGQFKIYTTSNPTLSVYKEASSASAISVAGVSWTLIDGINTAYATIPILYGYASPCTAGSTMHNVIRYSSSQYASFWGAAVQACVSNLAQHNVLDHMTIAYVQEFGTNGHCIKFAANNNVDNGQYGYVTNSTIHDCYYHGIQSSNAWSHNYMFGNRIYNTSLGGSGNGANIRCGWSGSSEPMNCHIFDNDLGGGAGGTGTDQGCGLFIQDEDVNTQIYRNAIHDHIWHGIYVFYTGSGATAANNLLIFNNKFYNNKTAGIRFDTQPVSAYLYNNSFYNNGEDSIAGTGATLSLNNVFTANVSFYNNIIQNTSADMIVTKNSYALASDDNILYRINGFRLTWNNVVYTTLAAYSDASAFAWDSHSPTTDPLYANPSSGDLRTPSPTTPAFSNGTNLVATVPKDYILAARHIPFDIGAYNAQGNLLVHPSLSFTSNFPSRTGSIAVTFTTTEINILNNWKIVFTLPSGFTLNSGGSTSVTSKTGIDGTVSTSISGQIVTITRNGDGTTIAPATISVTLGNIQNPTSSGLTGTFALSVTNSSDVEQAASNAIAGIVISDVSPRSLTGLKIGGAVI